MQTTVKDFKDNIIAAYLDKLLYLKVNNIINDVFLIIPMEPIP